MPRMVDPNAPYPQHYVGGQTNLPPIVMQGGQPTLGRYSRGPGAGQVAAMNPQQQAQYHARALAYATQRLRQIQQVMSALDPATQAQIAGVQQQHLDPTAAWRAISGAFAGASRQAGYQDPRYYLRYVLPEIIRSRQAQAANTMQGGV